MDDTSVDSTDTGYTDTEHSDTGADDSGYAESNSDSNSDSSGGYYDEVAGQADSGESSVNDVDTYDSAEDYDDSDCPDGTTADSSGETTESTDTPGGTTADTDGYDDTDTSTVDGTTTSDAGMSSQEAGAAPCPPAFPLSGVPASAGTPDATAVEPATTVAADGGMPAGTATPDTGLPPGSPTPIAVAPDAATTHVSYPAGMVEPSTTTVDMGGSDDGYIPAPQPDPEDLGLPCGLMPPEIEQQFVDTGWTQHVVPDGHGGQIDALRPPEQPDANTLQGQLMYLQHHLQTLLAQQQGLPAPATPTEAGQPVLPPPAGTGVGVQPTAVQVGPNHVAINYQPQLIPRTDTTPPPGYALNPANQATSIALGMQYANALGASWLMAAGADVVFKR